MQIACFAVPEMGRPGEHLRPSETRTLSQLIARSRAVGRRMAWQRCSTPKRHRNSLETWHCDALRIVVAC